MITAEDLRKKIEALKVSKADIEKAITLDVYIEWDRHNQTIDQVLAIIEEDMQEKDKPDIRSIIKIEIPYMPILSKNQSHRNIAINKRVPVKAYTEALKHIGLLIKGQMNKSKISFVEGKIWLDIMIYRPNMKGDPINFVDAFGDAVKKAIRVDDRWYSMVIDWELDKNNPRIIIEVKQ